MRLKQAANEISSSVVNRSMLLLVPLALCIVWTMKVGGYFKPLMGQQQALNGYATRHATGLNLTESRVAANSDTSYFAPPQADFDFCDSHNFIPEGKGGLERNENNSKPWFSLRRTDFAPHHSNRCETAAQVTEAIQYGVRQFDDPALNPPVASNWLRRTAGGNFTRSKFVTHGCDLHIMAPHELCHSVNRFSKILFQGDSLSRHAHQGLMVALSNDIVRGAIYSNDRAVPFNCQCDAQFSEHKGCREHDLSQKTSAFPYQRRLCSHLPIPNQVEITFNINRLHKGVYKLNQAENSQIAIDCADPSQKEVLVIVQGGLHLKYSVGGVMNKLVQPFLRDPVIQECIRQEKFYMIFSLASQQLPQYDSLYGSQDLNHSLAFNQGMPQAVQNLNISNVGFLHWTNFTEGALFSDGIHMSTQINYFKSQQIMNLANKMLDERLFVKHPDFVSSVSTVQ